MEIKYVYGTVGTVIIIACTIAMFSIGLSNSKVGNFQLNATACKTSNDSTSSECTGLVKFGVAPSAYIHSDEYRKAVDAKYLEAMKTNAFIAPQIAQFTLDYGVKNNIKYMSSVYEEFRNLEQE